MSKISLKVITLSLLDKTEEQVEQYDSFIFMGQVFSREVLEPCQVWNRTSDGPRMAIRVANFALNAKNF